jgi:hypothetical protein
VNSALLADRGSLRHTGQVEPLDAGQQRELEFLQFQPTAWVNMRPLKRWMLIGAMTTGMAVVVGGFAALVGGPW